MYVLVVAPAPQAIAQAGLHAALGRRRVGALGRHQAQHNGVVAAAFGAYGGALAGQAAANHQYVCVNDLHGYSLAGTAWWELRR